MTDLYARFELKRSDVSSIQLNLDKALNASGRSFFNKSTMEMQTKGAKNAIPVPLLPPLGDLDKNGQK